MNRPISPYVKYLRAARPRAKCTSEEPCTSVLSTSKNAADVRSGGGGGGGLTASIERAVAGGGALTAWIERSVTAACALASPAIACSALSTSAPPISDTNQQ